MDQIKTQLNKFIESKETITQLQAQIKELKTETKDIEELILNTMERSEVDIFNFNAKHVFKRKKKTSKSGLKKENVQSGIETMFKDPEFINMKNDESKAEFGAEIVMKTREEKESYVLETKPIKK